MPQYLQAARYLSITGSSGPASADALVVPAAFDAAAALRAKSRFAAFRYWRCDAQFYSRSWGAPLRVALFDALAAQYRQADSLSECRPNGTLANLYGDRPTGKKVDRSSNTRQGGTGLWLPQGSPRDPVFMEHATFDRYKFVFAMENSLDRGYFTEKAVNAVRANAVPIVAGWRGGAREDDFFRHHANPRRVVFCEFGRSNASIDGRRFGRGGQAPAAEFADQAQRSIPEPRRRATMRPCAMLCYATLCYAMPCYHMPARRTSSSRPRGGTAPPTGRQRTNA